MPTIADYWEAKEPTPAQYLAIEEFTVPHWEALGEVVKSAGYEPPEMYCLKDTLTAKYYQPYFPEKQSDEQSAKNAIRIEISGESEPVEVSELLPRLRPITTETRDQYRYYVPPEVRKEAEKLKKAWRAK